MKDGVIVMNKKIIDSRRVESMVRIGKNILHVNSTFGGGKSYSDILTRIIENKIRREGLE